MMTLPIADVVQTMYQDSMQPNRLLEPRNSWLSFVSASCCPAGWIQIYLQTSLPKEQQ